MNLVQSLVLGITQGLTEYIPVSSTAHLILAPELFQIPRANHTYDTIIQIGTVFPVFIYFWREFARLIAAAGRIVRNGRVTKDPEERMVKYLVLGSLPAGILGLLFEKRVDRLADPSEFPYAFLVIGTALIVVGLIMWWAEATSRKVRSIDHVREGDAWVVGFAQACALIPGVSRSGSTITAGLFTGLTREAAARFSFLLMTPIMLAATGYKVLKLLRGAEASTPDEWKGMLVATVIAGITGYFAIAFLMNWLRNRSLAVFAIYRILVGGFAIGLFFMQRPSHPGEARRGPAPRVRQRAAAPAVPPAAMAPAAGTRG